MKIVIPLDRFIKGNFPMVCVRSGLPATKMVRVQAYKPSIFRWYMIPGLDILLRRWLGESQHPWGRLPFAEGHVQKVSARYSRRQGITIRGVHPNFVAATK